MQRIGLIMVILVTLNISAAINDVPANVSQPVSNTMVKVVARMKSDEKERRPQCEAITKSGNRCSRRAAPGEKLCRQHLKARNRSTE